MSTEFRIEVSIPNAAESRRTAMILDLKSHLESYFAEENEEVECDLKKESEETQDLGSILAIILGAKVTVILATAISSWMRRTGQSEIRVKNSDGKVVVVKNVESQHIAEIFNKMSKD